MGRKIISLALILVIIFTGLMGCSKDGEKKVSTNRETSQNKKDMEKKLGRYIEEKVKLPELNANESIISVIMNKQKQLEIYTREYNKVSCYTKSDANQWDKSIPKWLNDGKANNENVDIVKIQIGKDGILYALCITYADNDQKSFLIKAEDDTKSSNIVDISYLNEKVNKLDEMKYCPYIQRFEVMKNGNIVMYDSYGNSNKLLVFSKEGEKLEDITTFGEQEISSYGDDVITVNEDNTGFMFYNTNTNTVDKTVEYKVDVSEDMEINNTVYSPMEDGTLFIGDSNGIHRLQKDGTLWETVVDGELNSMSMPSFRYDNLLVQDGESEEFYVSYRNDNNETYLMHYKYDKNISSVPQQEITVYSLNENKTIRQAIALYQSKNLDVKVNYVVGMEEEGGNPSDYIRALNTELLSGNGADVLVLDNLPMDSYMEKGVLADISDIIKPLEEKNEILTNISSAFYQGDKIYSMPSRISVPIIVGNQNVIKASNSLESIANYIKDTNKVYSCTFTYKELLCNNLALYGNEFLSNNGIDKGKLNQFLLYTKTVADNIKSTEVNQRNREDTKDTGNYFDVNYLFMSDYYGFLDGDNESVVFPHDSLNYTALTIAIANQRKDTSFDSINGMFIPKGELGLNAASKNKELAKDFIASIFSSEVQDTNTYDGLSVKLSSLNKAKDYIVKDTSTFAVSTQDGKEFDFENPKESELEDFIHVIESLTQPMETNQTINNMIVENALPYLQGKSDINQAVNAIEEKVNTYLEE